MSESGPEHRTASTGAKVAAAIGGFLAFYALGLVLAVLLNALEAQLGAKVAVAGALVALVVVVAVGVRMLRDLRGNGSRLRGATRWFALGFVAALVVFGGCLVLVVGA